MQPTDENVSANIIDRYDMKNKKREREGTKKY